MTRPAPAAELARRKRERTIAKWLARRWISPAGCWVREGVHLHRTGYDFLKYDGKQTSIHRLAFVFWRGPIPPGYTIDHECHNRDATCVGGWACPHRACFNPDHLRAVEGRVNTLAGRGVAAQHARKTHCPKGHPYAGENLVMDAAGHRRCRTCIREQATVSNQRRRTRV